MTSYKPRTERVVEIAQQNIKDRVQRAVAVIKSSGGVGFQAKATSQEELAYYKDQIFPNGQLNPQAFALLAERIGGGQLLDVIKSFEKDFAAQHPDLKEDASNGSN